MSEEDGVPDNASMLGFVAAALVLLLIPGPGVLYVVTRSLGQGLRAGLVSAAGLSAGAFVHVAAAAVGLSAILLASATAFGLVKGLGAAYLIYLGIRTLLARAPRSATRARPPRSSSRLFTDGVVVSVLNPKLAVFFLAFLPQFADPAHGPLARQILFLGVLYSALALVTDSGYALLAGHLRQWIGDQGFHTPLPRYASGAMYIGLGVSTALADRR